MAAASSGGGGSVMPAVVENGPVMPPVMPAVVENGSELSEENLDKALEALLENARTPDAGDIDLSIHGSTLHIYDRAYDNIAKKCYTSYEFIPVSEVRSVFVKKLNGVNILEIQLKDNRTFTIYDDYKAARNIDKELYDEIKLLFTRLPTKQSFDNTSNGFKDEFYKKWGKDLERYFYQRDILGFTYEQLVEKDSCIPYTYFRALPGLNELLFRLNWYMAHPTTPYTKSYGVQSPTGMAATKAGGARKTRRLRSKKHRKTRNQNK